MTDDIYKGAWQQHAKPKTKYIYDVPPRRTGKIEVLGIGYGGIIYDFAGINIRTSDFLTETKRVIKWKRTGGKTHTVTVSEETRPSRKVIKCPDGSFFMHAAVYEELKRSVL